MGIQPISCRIGGFWLLRGFGGDSHDFLREKSGGSAIWEEAAARRPRSRSLGRAEIPQARVRKKTSGRQTGGSYLAIKFGGDEFGPKDLSLALARGWLNIQLQKSMKDVVSEEGHQQKALDRFGIMLEDMIGVVTTENFARISTGSIWDDDRDSVGASRSFRQITRGSKVSVFLTRQVDEYAREM